MEQILGFKMLSIIQLKTTTRNLNKISRSFTHIAFHQADGGFGTENSEQICRGDVM